MMQHTFYHQPMQGLGLKELLHCHTWGTLQHEAPLTPLTAAWVILAPGRVAYARYYGGSCNCTQASSSDYEKLWLSFQQLNQETIVDSGWAAVTVRILPLQDARALQRGPLLPQLMEPWSQSIRSALAITASLQLQLCR